jgi:hypothetical protein
MGQPVSYSLVAPSSPSYVPPPFSYVETNGDVVSYVYTPTPSGYETITYEYTPTAHGW